MVYPLIRVEERDDQPGLHAVSDSSRWMSACPLTGFSKVKSVLDSGATDSCAPDCMCPEVKSRPAEGSRRGHMHTAAGGKKIANEGEKDITMVTGSNNVVQTNWETVDFTRPLSSVKQICLEGNRVVFGAKGGVICNIESGQETPFGNEGQCICLGLVAISERHEGFLMARIGHSNADNSLVSNPVGRLILPTSGGSEVEDESDDEDADELEDRRDVTQDGLLVKKRSMRKLRKPDRAKQDFHLRLPRQNK